MGAVAVIIDHETVLISAFRAERAVEIVGGADQGEVREGLWDRNTFTDEDGIEEASGFTMLKVDLTHFDSPEAERLRRQFDVAGVPTLVLLDASGREVREERTVGFVPPEVMLMRMRRVANASMPHVPFSPYLRMTEASAIRTGESYTGRSMNV